MGTWVYSVVTGLLANENGQWDTYGNGGGGTRRETHVSRKEFCPRTLPQPAPAPGSAARQLRNPVYVPALAPVTAPLQQLPGRAVTRSKVPLLTGEVTCLLLPLQPLVCGKEGRGGHVCPRPVLPRAVPCG